MIQIYDPVEGFVYVLPPESTIAIRMKLFDPKEVPTAVPKVGAQDQHASAQASAKTSAQSSAPPPAPKPTVESERLEPQEMEGLLTTGRRITRTIAVGAEGNDRALTIVTETWSSQDMGIMLLEKNSDPRSGASEKRMTNLVQAEPDVAMFQVPADYTIKDQQ
ncbi:MAG: hypothetical protein WB780_15500 [Candidatus Acidiferrales bacterium]